jgi:SAM-dependent methyltransferase
MRHDEAPFLGFYRDHGVIPTRQDVVSQERFLLQRDHLLRSLGIPSVLLKGKRIIEIGPGTGQKAQHLLSLRPARYVAVDGNEASLAMTSDAIASSGFEGSAEVRFADFANYEDADSYDVVLAEAVVPTQQDPESFLLRLKSLLPLDGGVLIYTCMDAVSLLPEILRRAIVRDLGLNTGDLLVDSENVAAFFEADLDCLQGMDRRRTDWAIDQMLHPWSGPLLDIPSSLAFLGDGVEFLGSSPRLASDGRWYKDPSVQARSSLDWETDSFWTHCHNLVDIRVWSEGRPAAENEALYAAAGILYEVVMQPEWESVHRQEVATIAREFGQLLPRASTPTLASLRSFLLYWDTGNRDELGDFRSWWGRGQQYVSVVAAGRGRVA